MQDSAPPLGFATSSTATSTSAHRRLLVASAREAAPGLAALPPLAAPASVSADTVERPLLGERFEFPSVPYAFGTTSVVLAWVGPARQRAGQASGDS